MDSSNSEKNAGVSIEPISKHKYHRFQRIIYFGGIANTHFGMVYATSDLLLKRLSLSFDKINISGFPSEWDFALNNQKSGRQYKPWEDVEGRSYFFPTSASISNDAGCAVLVHLTIRVISADEKFANFMMGSLNLNYSEIKKVLNRDPNASGAIYAKLFSQHMEDAVNQYPVLLELRNCIAMPSLFRTLLRADSSAILTKWMEEYKYWQNYRIAIYKTPDSVRTLSRTVSGVKYRTSISGGLFSTIEPEQQDPWTELVLGKDAVFLKEGVLKSRPNDTALCWQIPLGYGSPDSWRRTMVQNMHATLQKKYSSTFITPRPTYNIFARQNSGDLTTYPSNWKTNTNGKNLFEFNSELIFSYGGAESYSPQKNIPERQSKYSFQQPSIYSSTVTFGILPSLEFVLNNKISLGIKVPVTLKVFTLDVNTTPLPGITDNIVSLAAGIENPSIYSQIQLFSGIKSGRIKLPSLILENSIELPANNKTFEQFLSGKELGKQYDPFKYGSDQLSSTHSLTSGIPVTSSINMVLSGALTKQYVDTGKSQYRDFSGSLRIRLDRKIGVTFALAYSLYYSNSPILIETNTPPRRSRPNDPPFTPTFADLNSSHRWLKQGQVVSASLLFPGKGDYSTITFGYYRPEQIFADQGRSTGSFFINFNLNGARIFNKRFWF